MKNMIERIINNNNPENILFVGSAAVLHDECLNKFIAIIKDGKVKLFHEYTEDHYMQYDDLYEESEQKTEAFLFRLESSYHINLSVYVGEGLAYYASNKTKKEIWNSVLETAQLPGFMPDERKLVFRYDDTCF